MQRLLLILRINSDARLCELTEYHPGAVIALHFRAPLSGIEA